ncbi:MAG: Ribosomal RNA small subunit methyltransferase A [Elusimicrobia bacterium ADurb.Bin231]|nr:MAG: Ribosomal RNA small subunit methyltransferase A [Elusimicrobia bacterium ADurb.Bin231]
MKKVLYGQNFLIDKNIAAKITNIFLAGNYDTAVEIGPGKGILTENIVIQGKNILAVEIDRQLCCHLEKKFAKYPNIEIFCGDFLKWDPPTKKILGFIANIPYYITSPIIEKILEMGNWSIAVLMVQKEVADRMNARLNTREYGNLSIACQSVCKVKKLFDVPPHCFYPKPKVYSSVVQITPLSHPFIAFKQRKKLFSLIKAAFFHRRKTILNSISISLNLQKQLVLELLRQANIEISLRPESINIPEYVQLLNIIDNSEHKNTLKNF